MKENEQEKKRKREKKDRLMFYFWTDGQTNVSVWLDIELKLAEMLLS